MRKKADLSKILAVVLSLICAIFLSGCSVNETYVSSDAQAGGSIVTSVASSLMSL